jgi:hypothetical protein
MQSKAGRANEGRQAGRHGKAGRQVKVSIVSQGDCQAEQGRHIKTRQAGQGRQGNGNAGIRQAGQGRKAGRQAGQGLLADRTRQAGRTGQGMAGRPARHWDPGR